MNQPHKNRHYSYLFTLKYVIIIVSNRGGKSDVCWCKRYIDKGIKRFT